MHKIAFFINDLRAGGAEKNLAFIANGFVDKFEVIVACYDHREENSFFKLDYRIQKISLKMHFEKLKNIIEKKEKKEYIRKQADEIERILAIEKPDISIAFLPNMCMLVADACEKLNQKCIVCARNDPTKELNSKDGLKKRDEAFKKSAGCVFQTEEIKSYFNNETQKHSIVIPNPVMLTEKPINKWEVRRNSIVSVSKYSLQKNQKMLLDAFKVFNLENPQYTLEIYGKDYGEKEKLIEYATDLEIIDKVFFEDEKKDIQSIIRNAKIFALSSNYEGMPNALAEAVALGIPSISTNCPFGGPKSILDNGNNGILIPVGDTYALYCAFRTLATNIKLYHDYSEKGKLIIKERSPQIILQKWIDYVLELIGENDFTRT